MVKTNVRLSESPLTRLTRTLTAQFGDPGRRNLRLALALAGLTLLLLLSSQYPHPPGNRN